VGGAYRPLRVPKYNLLTPPPSSMHALRISITIDERTGNGRPTVTWPMTSASRRPRVL